MEVKSIPESPILQDTPSRQGKQQHTEFIAICVALLRAITNSQGHPTTLEEEMPPK